MGSVHTLWTRERILLLIEESGRERNTVLGGKEIQGM